MRVPLALSNAFGAPFEALIARFCVEKGLLPTVEDIRSHRFLARSIIPHIQKLSSLFNREEKAQNASLDPYWKESSNPANLRLAYFLYFMPSNLFRMASVWSELHRLGFRWSGTDTLSAIEWGAGPASGACGIAAGEKFAPCGIPSAGSWALIEQDKQSLELGSSWAEAFFGSAEFSPAPEMPWSIRKFHRKVDTQQGLLPRAAPVFNLWISSFFLNELSLSATDLARELLASWEKHLADEGIVILVEPALKLQSRRLLELRAEIIAQQKEGGFMKVLLPCLGHQACGALTQASEDWCHEEVSWWRPPYFRTIDSLANLDRKTLPFSYLVLMKTKRELTQVLPGLQGSPNERYRLVSPAHSEGKDEEFFVCGQDGKRRARFRSPKDDGLERGDILEGTQLQGDRNSTKISSIRSRK